VLVFAACCVLSKHDRKDSAVIWGKLVRFEPVKPQHFSVAVSRLLHEPAAFGKLLFMM
jgi:hypothetical protein